ncbi:MAG: type VI secretion system tip protein VgrG [Phaeodactylibacter sp.]|nr:type VI secretion system tip protein VgrG [Phaeodactylibacter sp.]
MKEERIIATSRPADRATFTIKIEGTVLDATYRVGPVQVFREINRIPWARVILLDGEAAKADFPASNSDLFIPGKIIEILAGYHTDEATIFRGIIIKHRLKARSKGAPLLILDCRDEAVKMTIGRHSRYFYEMSDSDIMEELISAYGLKSEVEATGPALPQAVQYDCTDWGFLMMRAEVNGMLCIVEDGTVTVKPPLLDADPVTPVIFGATIQEFDAEIDARQQLKAVSALSWDYALQEPTKVEGTDPKLNLNGNLAPGSLAEAAGPEALELRHGGNLGDEQLQAWADATLLRQQLAKVRGRVKFQGIPEVKPGALIELRGVGERFNGKAFVSAVTHSLADGDWQAEVQFGFNPESYVNSYETSQKPASAVIPAVQGLQLGLVTSLEDPDGEHRIKVRMPVIDATEEGSWARFACPDAGENRGLYFRPEVDDEVLVGFINGDPRDAVVLGMLHSSAKASPIKEEDANNEKGIVTRSELKLIFNDEKKSITLETPAGKKVTVDEDQGILQMEDENGNKAILNPDGITLESTKDIILKAAGDVKVEGVNIEQKASANYKVEGSAGMEVSSSATTVVKGSLVQIN